MTVISASSVKDLREKTGAGMMECKKALTESGGDFEKAVDLLRQKGLASAAKKATRSASQGVISVTAEGSVAVIAEMNCETDFVARTDDFRALVEETGSLLLKASDPSAVTARIEEMVKEKIPKLGAVPWGRAPGGARVGGHRSRARHRYRRRRHPGVRVGGARRPVLQLRGRGLHQRVVLIGTGGVLELTEPFVTWLRQPRLTVRIRGSEQVTAFEPVDTFRREIEDLCAAIRCVSPPLLGPEEAVRNARILDRVTAAARGRLAWNGGST